MPQLVLGPLLRYVGDSEATVWVETDAPCEVEVLDHSARTFAVGGHHYAIVCLEGLEPGSSHEYEVTLDGHRVWPPQDSPFPPSTIRTLESGRPLKIVFGSCRLALPHEPPYTLTKDEDPRGREHDALRAFALRMIGDHPVESWPHLLVQLGDQVYADEVSLETLEFIRARRDVRRPPGEEVADFEEYTRLYRESWSDPTIRWLFSTVPSAMVFDDHDVHDDWNISDVWLEEMRSKHWWDERIAAAFATYWVYQHLGNLSPGEVARDELLARAREEEDAGPLLREFGLRADRETTGSRWSYCRDLGRTRLVVMDSRARRILRGKHREMLDDGEWDWLEEHATGGFDHLLLATTLPFLLSPGMHYLEAWSEAVCRGAWGAAAAGLGERVRQGLDFEHWAAFEDSFDRLAAIVESVAAGARGEPPASIVALSGDVHHAYLAEVAFRRSARARSAVYQAVCSPMRNPLDWHERLGIRVAASGVGTVVGRALARAAGVAEPRVRWRFLEPLRFDNQVGTLELDGREALARLEKTVPGDSAEPVLETVFERRLS